MQAQNLAAKLLSETDFASFNKMFGNTMNSLQNIMSQFILMRLSLPDPNNEGTGLYCFHLAVILSMSPCS